MLRRPDGGRSSRQAHLIQENVRTVCSGGL